MQQHHYNEEQMRRNLYEAVLRMQQQNQPQTFQNIILAPPQPQPPMAMIPYQPPQPPPPPPPGAGAIALLPVPVPRPAPTIKPPSILKQRSSSRDPYDKAGKNNKTARVAPWNSGVINPPSLPPLPTPVLLAPIPLPQTPGTGSILPAIPAGNAPVPLPPLSFPRGRAARSLATQSTRYPSTEAGEGRRSSRSRSTETRAATVVLDSVSTAKPRVTRPRPIAKARGTRVKVDGPVETISFQQPPDEPPGAPLGSTQTANEEDSSSSTQKSTSRSHRRCCYCS